MTDLLASRDAGALAGGATLAADVVAASNVDSDLTPIDWYLREQHTMTAVDRFSRHHDEQGRLDRTGEAAGPTYVPDQARYYRDLIPLEQPVAGQQYGFDVDLDSCSGCKACVTACHSLNGLDDGEAFRSVGTLLGSSSSPVATEPALNLSTLTIEPWQQSVTTACHHCVDPACLNGCPVDAYEKDPITGIVSHLDDQCIGCSYCTLMCPYDVPQFNAERGIVRKCDLCKDRLAVGEAPACVQACPTSAISVRMAEVADLVALVRPDQLESGSPVVSNGVAATTAAAATAAGRDDHRLVPTAPRSRLTIPTTRYRSTRPIPIDARPADHFSLLRGHAHPPLTVMLVLTQLAVGAFTIGWLIELTAAPALANRVRPFATGVALAVGLLALAASTLHLGRPQYAWRAVIGLRHSWLSREIVAFGVFAALATAYAAMTAAAMSVDVVRVLGALVVITGVLGVICSVMVYRATGRRWWRARVIAPKFALTATMTGSATVILAALATTVGDASAYAAVREEIVRPLALVVIAASVLKLLGEVAILRHRRDRDYTELRRTTMLLTDDLIAVTVWRSVAGILGGLVLPLVLVAIAADPNPPKSVAPTVVVAGLALIAVTAGELCERWQFFAAITSPRMPGGLQ